MSIIRLLTEGGMPFEAIHKYAPMCNRFARVIFNKGPSTLETVKEYMIYIVNRGKNPQR